MPKRLREEFDESFVQFRNSSGQFGPQLRFSAGESQQYDDNSALTTFLSSTILVPAGSSESLGGSEIVFRDARPDSVMSPDATGVVTLSALNHLLSTQSGAQHYGTADTAHQLLADFPLMGVISSAPAELVPVKDQYLRGVTIGSDGQLHASIIDVFYTDDRMPTMCDRLFLVFRRYSMPEMRNGQGVPPNQRNYWQVVPLAVSPLQPLDPRTYTGRDWYGAAVRFGMTIGPARVPGARDNVSINGITYPRHELVSPTGNTAVVARLDVVVDMGV